MSEQGMNTETPGASMGRPLIVLATATARYTHAAFGLRCLRANLGALREQSVICEFNLSHTPPDIVESILLQGPAIVALSVHIWNYSLMTEVARILKAVRPDVCRVVGGPEAAHEYAGTPMFEAADYLVRGEGEETFAQLAASVLAGERPDAKVIEGVQPSLDTLVSPYAEYTAEDIAHKVLYVETTRGCPFRCAFCLSSLDPRVREFPLEPFFAEMDALIERGARRFKFVDRTFNVGHERAEAVCEFFLGHWRDGMQLHFEIVPDLLDDRMFALMRRFPAEGLHLEVGVQSFNPRTLHLIARPQDTARTTANLSRIRTETGALVHADLVAGLPEETLDTFAAGFDRLLETRPHAIQVGILKRLKGAPIAELAEPHGLAFSGQPPYEVLQTSAMSFDTLQAMKRFARYWDLYFNAGHFPTALPLLWSGGRSAFRTFWDLSAHIWQKTGRTHEIPLMDRAVILHDWMTANGLCAADEARAAIEADYHRLRGRREKLPLGS
jgi:hypothetical protein